MNSSSPTQQHNATAAVHGTSYVARDIVPLCWWNCKAAVASSSGSSSDNFYCHFHDSYMQGGGHLLADRYVLQDLHSSHASTPAIHGDKPKTLPCTARRLLPALPAHHTSCPALSQMQGHQQPLTCTADAYCTFAHRTQANREPQIQTAGQRDTGRLYLVRRARHAFLGPQQGMHSPGPSSDTRATHACTQHWYTVQSWCKLPHAGAHWQAPHHIACAYT